MPVATGRALPRVVKKCQFAFAADNWPGRGCMRGGKSAFGCAFPERLPDRHRLAETLDREFAQERVFEKIRGEPMRRRTDQHAARLRVALQPGGEIGRVANNSLLAGRAYAARFAGNDNARRYAHAGLQRLSVPLLQPCDLVDDLQSGAHGAFGRVLLRQGKTEIDQYAITKILRDEPVIFANYLHAGVAVLAQHLDKIFRITVRSPARSNPPDL